MAAFGFLWYYVYVGAPVDFIHGDIAPMVLHIQARARPQPLSLFLPLAKWLTHALKWKYGQVLASANMINRKQRLIEETVICDIDIMDGVINDIAILYMTN